MGQITLSHPNDIEQYHKFISHPDDVMHLS